MKKRKNKKLKNKTVVLPLNIFKKAVAPDKNLRKAAKKEVRNIVKHLKTDGWPLDYGTYVNEVFYTAFGHHLENYLLKALAQTKSISIQLVSNPKGSGLLIEKVTK